jgi:hypothetical protein
MINGTVMINKSLLIQIIFFIAAVTAAEGLDYVPIPESVVRFIKGMWTKEIRTVDGKEIFIGK